MCMQPFGALMPLCVCVRVCVAVSWRLTKAVEEIDGRSKRASKVWNLLPVYQHVVNAVCELDKCVHALCYSASVSE
jgi:hypothetical protein